MGTLMELAAGIDPDEARMHAMEVAGDREQTLREETAKAEWKAAMETEVPEYVQTSADGIREALTGGGRAVLSVRSRKTGAHVTILVYCRKRKEGGQGWVSRATVAGRVGIADADCIEARAEDLEYPENYVGRLYLNDGQWRSGREADALRAWAAEKVLAYALAGYPLDHQADVFIATSCSYCGKRLTDPVSVERGVGPECYGRATGSKVAHV